MSTSKTIVNVNGELVPPGLATVSIFDRGFLYGDSVYEVTMTENGKPIFLKEHLDRLERSATLLGIDVGMSRQQLTAEINKGIEALGLPRVYIRIIITRGEGEIGLDPNLSSANNLFIITKELPEHPQSWYTQGVWMIVADVMRNPKKAIDPNIKSGNYLNNVMAIREAKKVGAFDAIMLNHKGQVTEGTTSNIWIVKNGKIFTPPLKAGLLGGITRGKLLEIGQKYGLEMIEENFTPIELKSSDECFLTSSTKEIVPIVKVDQTTIGSGKPGPMTQKLHQYYKKFVKSGL